MLFASVSVFGMKLPNESQRRLSEPSVRIANFWSILQDKKLDENKKIRLVKDVLRSGNIEILLSSADEEGNTLFLWAVKNKKTELLKFIMKSVDDLCNPFILSYLFAYKNKESWSEEKLNKHIVCMNEKISDIINAQNKKRETALIMKIEKDEPDFNTIILLLNYGADVNKEDKYHLSPLTYALINNHKNIVKYLVEHGANVNAKYRKSAYPLKVAVDRKSESMVKFLLENGADLHSELLLYASRIGANDIVKLLLKYGTDVNFRDNSTGNVALHYAVQLNLQETVKLLVEHGADVNAADDCGVTPLYIASERRYKNIAKYLIEHGAEK